MVSKDAFHTIATTHPVCQDYAVHGQLEAGPYVIVSDGCSTAPDSDWGSRLLCRLTIPYLYEPTNSARNVIYPAETLCRTLNLDVNALSATLLTLRMSKTEFLASIFGDGLMVAREKGTKKLIVESVEFTSGAPYYPRYELSEQVRQQYLAEFPGTVRIHRYELLSDGSINTLANLNWELTDWISFAGSEQKFPRDQFDLVAVMSDGVRAFMQMTSKTTGKNWQSVPVDQVLLQMFDFKNYAGAFVERRCRKALAKMREEGIENQDDFSLGAIYCDE